MTKVKKNKKFIPKNKKRAEEEAFREMVENGDVYSVDRYIPPKTLNREKPSE